MKLRFNKKKLTQPQAQEYCSKQYNGGILHDFQSDMVDGLEKGKYWTGLVLHNEGSIYEFSGGFLNAAKVKGSKSDKELCVMAEKKEGEGTVTLHSSKCCKKREYFICKIPEDETVAGNYCYAFCTFYSSVLL